MDDYIKRKDAVDWFMGFIHLGEDNIPADTVVGDLKYAIPAAAADVEPVRRWIPVSERLPELIPCSAGTAYSEAVNVWTTGQKVMVGVWDGIDWIAPFDFWEAWDDDVTHWMPLPEPPKMDGGGEDAAD